eukprot:12970-Heterococcus_DN1.PRE.1
MHTHSSSSSSSTAAAAAAGSATDKQYQHTLCTCSEPWCDAMLNGQDHADLAPADSSTASIAACAQLLVPAAYKQQHSEVPLQSELLIVAGTRTFDSLETPMSSVAPPHLHACSVQTHVRARDEKQA